MNDYVLGALETLAWVRKQIEAGRKPAELKAEINSLLKEILDNAALHALGKVKAQATI
ncbi:hypothetical protein [Candidatus Hecatella orcuttiae]|uniref:hypothetical protein n=1 Tax=Candidatus Hecatella orcuttiae TaxID=1935119 RepID=UPI00286801A4|nr:hypothetical protein [Candidatus Hecatella orcuttiae]